MQLQEFSVARNKKMVFAFFAGSLNSAAENKLSPFIGVDGKMVVFK